MKLKFYQLFFWTLWFFVIPLGLTLLAISLLDSGERELPEGLFGAFRYFVQNQKVPAMIVLFVVFELPFYHFRYSLPLVSKLGIAGRPGLPKDLRASFEDAKQLHEDLRSVLALNRAKLESDLGSEIVETIGGSVARLKSALEAETFSRAEFEDAVKEAYDLGATHLSKYQKGEAREISESIFIAVAVAFALRAFVVEAFQIPSGSMLPTLQIRDHIFVNKFVYGPTIPFTKKRILSNLPPKHGDIIVFEYPDPVPTNPRPDYIKRAIALPGDILEVDGGHPIINGWTVPSCRVGEYGFENDYGGITHADLFVEFLGDVSYLTMFEGGRHEVRQGPYKVKEGEFWVLGDNRNNSSDSRAWRNGLGAGVPFENVRGRAMFVWLGFNRTGNDFLGVTWDRLFTNVMGHPRLPKEAPEELKTGIEKCLASRPAQTTPPAPSAAALVGQR